ncbi:manganese ABC transporter permease MntD [soil metagenome]
MHQVFIAPWSEFPAFYGWIVLMGFLVTLSCGIVGNFLVLRRMALVGDAISHGVLPGIVLAFLFLGTRDSWAMVIGAMVAGVATTLLIEVIHTHSRVKQDAAIGITFSTLFAIGVILVSLYASKVDLDQDCVLYGEVSQVASYPPAVVFGVAVAPQPIFVMGLVTVITVVLVGLFYKQLLVSSFDAGLARSLGINPRVVHYALMALVSVIVVSAFESVGAILVVAMLILPAATAYLVTDRLPVMLALTAAHAALSSFFGLHLGIALDSSLAGAMVVVGFVLFCAAWAASSVRKVAGRRSALSEVSGEPMAGT